MLRSATETASQALLSQNDELLEKKTMTIFQLYEQEKQQFQQQGVQQGVQLGAKQGAEQERYGIANKMLAMDIDIDTILKATELSLEEIENLKKDK